MKVKIGNYKNWVGPYQIAEKILFWKKKYDDEIVHKFGEWLASFEWLVKLCEWIDSKKKRTIKVKVDDFDVWNVDSTLAYIIHPVLVKLKETKHGSPHVDDEDVPEHLRSTAVAPANDGETDDNFHKRWDYVLDEMIFAFKNVNEDWEDQFWKRQPKLDLKPRPEDEGQASIPVRVLDHGEFDREGHNKFEERMQNGFRLFGKYYRGMWD